MKPPHLALFFSALAALVVGCGQNIQTPPTTTTTGTNAHSIDDVALEAKADYHRRSRQTKLPAAQRKILEDSSRFQAVLSVTNLPPAIVALCSDKNGKLAEPGADWEMTDYIWDISLPRKALIWAAVSGEYYVVHYERGGYGYTSHVLVATLAKGDSEPKVVWRSVVDWDGIGRPLENYSEFLDALKGGHLDDTIDRR